MDAETVLKRSPNATFQVVAEEAILIHVQTGTYYSLNKVGTEFWNLLDGKQTLAQHAATLAAQYDVDTAMVLGDLIELAQDMAAEDLVDVI